jgi:LysR family transcriptional activator of nhaA
MNHRLDLILTNFPPAVTDNTKIFAKSVGRLPVVVCGSKQQLKLKKNFPQSLAGAPLILPTLHSKLRHDLEHFFRLQQIPMNIISECQDTSLQLQMGAEGLGLVALAAPAAADFVKKGQLVSLGQLPQVSEEIWLVAAKRKVENTVAARLWKRFQIQM